MKSYYILLENIIPANPLMKAAEHKTFCVCYTDKYGVSSIISRSIDYTKFDGLGFDLGNYLEAKAHAQKMIDAINKSKPKS